MPSPSPEGPGEPVRMQLNQDTTSDYGHGAAKGGEVLGIGVPEIKLAAPVFGEQSRKLSRALTTLITTLDGLGEPWGDAPSGEKFAEAYKPNQKNIERAAGVLTLGLVSVHEALDDMKDGHVDNDDLVKGIFTKATPPEKENRGGPGE